MGGERNLGRAGDLRKTHAADRHLAPILPHVVFLLLGVRTTLVILGRRAAASPEPIFQRPVFMGSGLAGKARAPE
jgi:hypothetical protein